MKIRDVEISNILGTASASFRPGTLTVISGSNGSGKTSIIDALRRVFEGGSDAGLLRRGSKVGEVILTLEDDRKIKMRVTPRQTSYEVENADGTSTKAPRAFIEELADALSIDPARLLTTKPKDLAAFLLEVMPIRFSREEFNACLVGNAGAERGTEGRGGQAFPPLTLDELDAQRKQIYEGRTAVNRRTEDAKSTVRSLRSSLPDQDDQDWGGIAAGHRETLEDAKRSRESDIAAADRAEREAIDEIREKAQRQVEQVQAEANQKRRDIDTEWAPSIQKMLAAVATAEERQRTQDKASGIRESIQQWEEKAKTAERESRECTATLEHIEELKRRKLASLPIPGLEVRDGQVFYDGVAFEHVNLAERMKIAFQICALRSNGKLPFLILDEAECFDSETWEMFKQASIASGFQVIAARVGEGPLSIETIEESAAVA